MVRKNNQRKLSKSESGRLGGLVRVEKGNIGTEEGRRKGGLHSLETHRTSKTGFKLLRPVRAPKRSAAFAELIGVMYGDGHVDKYQATITTNADTDSEHAQYIQKLVHAVFKLTPSFSLRKDSKACTITINSRNVCDYFEREGIPRGNKIAQGLSVPHWINAQGVYKYAFTRGLFDSDGCVFQDVHLIRGKEYRNIGIAFASKSRELLVHFTQVLTTLGLHPTQTTPHRVFLRRAKEVDTYFRVIGSSNAKHLGRYAQFRR
ncbi:MAG: hypothetical protein NBV63_00710 [Candidatus Pacebacteria bacterium]|nr:hypothetical protein [Candidatus Paceibacterota bacterium]